MRLFIKQLEAAMAFQLDDSSLSTQQERNVSIKNTKRSVPPARKTSWGEFKSNDSATINLIIIDLKRKIGWYALFVCPVLSGKT